MKTDDTHEQFISRSILRDMSEGVLTLGLDGIVTFVNPAAEQILSLSAAKLVGKPFAASFFERPENDAFNQTVLDAIYDSAATHKNVVSYETGSGIRQLHVTTSFLRDGAQKVGVIAVLSDISELMELRDAVKAMERIRTLNGQLELRNQLLSETFGRFLSDEIVRQLLDTPDGLMLGGKKRTLTIVMSDLRGFTALSERMPAQDLLSMLNHYLGEMTGIIQGHGGTIIEFIGDGIMAIFGAPAPSETHAYDATACAVEMEARMADVNAWNAARGYPELEMGVGVNTGEVIVGNIGSEKRTKYGVVGQHVNLCGRIESYTVGGQVLLSPLTRSMIAEPLEVAQEIEVYPKGVGTPLLVAQVTGIGALSCNRAEADTAVALMEPLSAVFYVIHDKHCDETPSHGALTAWSTHSAWLSTDAALAPYDNLKLDTPAGDLFAKVLRAGPSGGWLLRFTSTPQEMPADESELNLWRKPQ